MAAEAAAHGLLSAPLTTGDASVLHATPAGTEAGPKEPSAAHVEEEASPRLPVKGSR